jgi:proline iminopeptidase
LPLGDALAAGSHSISINGIEQRYHVAGQGPLCIAHPGGPGIDWSYLKMPLVERHLTVLYIEPIGTGASGRLPEHPKGYGVDRYSQQLEGLVDALGLSGFFMLGHSHGGFVIQQYAVARPHHVAGLIVYDSSAVTGPEFMKEASRNIAAFAQRESGSAEAAEVTQTWASIPRIAGDEDFTQGLRRLLPAYFADYRRAGPAFDQLRSALRATFVVGDGKPFDITQALPGLRRPVLILVGEHDFICGPRWADILHAALPTSQLVSFARSGHMAHIEEPGAFAAAIASFVANVGGA